jgi:hypothetical protein
MRLGDDEEGLGDGCRSSLTNHAMMLSGVMVRPWSEIEGLAA